MPFLLHGSVSPEHRNSLDGIAVISAVVGSQKPKEAAAELRKMVDSFKRARAQHDEVKNHASFPVSKAPRTAEALIEAAAGLMEVVRENTPLVHQVRSPMEVLIQITNNVVINDSANATLAVGASPIMATHPLDVADLSPVIGSLLVNFGTITDKEGMLVAGRLANVNRKPLVYDPVAVGATSFRRETSKGETSLIRNS